MKKRSIVVSGHATSISMEDAFWKTLGEIAEDRKLSLSAVITQIDQERSTSNLSSAIRLFILHELQHKIVSIQADPSKRL
jgi:predicted DNA-binding ribbon-helix-helix protein